jgi:FkbM family methyltransferase
MNNVLTIVDVGAANGYLTANWDSKVRLITFEPDPRSALDLEGPVNTHGDMVFNTALGSIEETKKLNLMRKKEVSSFLEPNRQYLNLFPDSERWDIVDKISLSVKSLDSLKKKIGNIDFIKLDTQGTELDILKGASKSLDCCLALEIEVEFLELYTGQPLFGDICNFLSHKGFEFYDFLTEYRYGRRKLDRKGQLAFADALFMRTPENIFDCFGKNPDKINKYLTICEHFGKTDLAEIVYDYKKCHND